MHAHTGKNNNKNAQTHFLLTHKDKREKNVSTVKSHKKLDWRHFFPIESEILLSFTNDRQAVALLVFDASNRQSREWFIT